MFVAKCKPSSYKVAPGDYAIDANGEIAVVVNIRFDPQTQYDASRSLPRNVRRVSYRVFIGDCVTFTYRSTFYRNDRNDDDAHAAFSPIKYISRADIIDHFNMNVIYNYRTYTQAFYDIFTLNGNDIALRDKDSIFSPNSIHETIDDLVSKNQEITENLSSVQNMVINHENILYDQRLAMQEREQNTILQQNALLLEQNSLLLQLLTMRNVPEQADLLQL